MFCNDFGASLLEVSLSLFSLSVLADVARAVPAHSPLLRPARLELSIRKSSSLACSYCRIIGRASSLSAARRTCGPSSRRGLRRGAAVQPSGSVF